MNYRPVFITATATLLLDFGCSTPDVVVRPGSTFSKNSTITLTAGQDNAIFKPELEKELIRKGYNVISDTVAQTISLEKKSSDLKTAGVAVTNQDSAKAAAKSEGDQVTEKKVSTVMKSDFVGKIEYLYIPGKHTVSRVNFSIIELSSGVVVVSLGYEKSGSNADVAKEIVKQLDTALSK